MVRSLGAHQVIDYTQEDFTRSGQCYDLIFDGVGNHPLLALKRLLNPDGAYIAVGAPPHGRWIGPLAHSFKTLVFSWFVTRKLVLFLAKIRSEDLTILRELMELGKVTPVIDKCYKLNEVPEAIRYLEEGHARGKVIITSENNNKS